MLTIGSYQFRADTIPLRSGSLLLIQGSKGMLGCGYLSVDTAEKLGDALAVVTGVKSYEDMLKAIWLELHQEYPWRRIPVPTSSHALGIGAGAII